MIRLRNLVLVLAVAFSLGAAAPALAQEENPGEGPAVVLEDEAEEESDEAWTFRYLVPTLMVGSAVVVLAVLVGYGIRIRGRYRVAP